MKNPWWRALCAGWMVASMAACGGSEGGQDDSGDELNLEEFQVNTTPISFFSLPIRVSSAPDASFRVIWGASFSSDSSKQGIHMQKVDARGRKGGNEIPVLPPASTDAGGLHAIAVGPSGETFVSYWTRPGRVMGRRFAADGSPQGPEFAISSASFAQSVSSEVAIGSGGHAVVVWSATDFSERPTGDGLWGQRFAADGTRLGAEFQILRVGRSGRFPDPQVSVAPDGAFAVVYSESAGDRSKLLYLQRYGADGQRAGGPVLLADTSGCYSGVANLTRSSHKWDVLVLQCAGPSGSAIQRYSPDGSRLGSRIELGAGFLDSIAIDSAGRFVVAMTPESNAGSLRMWLRRFAADGSAAGAVLQVGSEEALGTYASDPSVALADNGRILLVWARFGGGDESIRARLLAE